MVWWITHETTHTPDDHVARLGRGLERRFSSLGQLQERPTVRQATQKLLYWLQSLTVRDIAVNMIIRPLEVANTAWLIYTIFAQTLGAFQTCDCMASTWTKDGGYIDFETCHYLDPMQIHYQADLRFRYQYYAAHGVYLVWGIATGISLLVLGAGLAYIVFEYCTQAHLSTEDYDRAMKGLKHTRWFKKHTLFIRIVPDVVINWGKLIWHKVTRGSSRRGRRSLVWTATCKKNPPVIHVRMEPGLHMQGTEEQWRNVFFGRSTSGLSSSMSRSPNPAQQSPAILHSRVDLEKGETN
ncbi:MAG: hypothetical protein Q9213_000801 [Squamulea squamosa]